MEVTARHNYLKMSPRKVSLVARSVVGLPVTEAEDCLSTLNKKASTPLLKLIHSAVASAANNLDVAKEHLYIKALKADQGPTLYRWKPRAFGRATPIRKRSTHLTLVLGVEEGHKIAPASAKSKKEGIDKPKLVTSLGEMLKRRERAESQQKETPPEHPKNDFTDKRLKYKKRTASTRPVLPTGVSGESDGLKTHSDAKDQTKEIDKRKVKDYGKGFIKRIFSRKTG